MFSYIWLKQYESEVPAHIKFVDFTIILFNFENSCLENDSSNTIRYKIRESNGPNLYYDCTG